MPYKLKKVGDRVGVYKLNGKLVRKFKSKTTANKMIKVWNKYEKRSK
tara:strand:- start:1902 stop:2042 length:141 start_codon:yes stop_codon:yes gene_type:complete